MRILAVRGRNLASLAEPFEIDLTAEPLAGAGLFAITGETGAGKSTLLDAICLALYGDFPRIAARGADEEVPDASGETLKARDARSILRRGASTGFCEVDFVAVDGLTYRAAWAVYRARGKDAGRLQPVSRLIQRLGPDGLVIETVADQIRAVDARIVELTDFTFEQFRRTVLLAQGDFDAFLRADDRERADLLEKITGTAIYARLSARTFDRARTAREAVVVLETRRRDVGLLDAPARADRLARRAALAERLKEVTARREAAHADLASLDRLAAAETRLAEAEAEVDAAEAADVEARGDRDHLARIDRAIALRPAVDALDKARAAEIQAIAALAEVETRLAEATPRLGAASEAREAARATLRRTEERIAAFIPAWDGAAQLDARIAEARREVADAEPPCHTAAAARDEEKARLALVDGRRVDIAAELARLEHELTRLADIAPLAERWPDVEARLGERLTAAREAETAARRRTAAETIAAMVGARLAAHDAAEVEDAGLRADLDGRISERRAALASLDEPAVRTRDAALAALQGDVARLTPIAQSRAAAYADLATASADSGTAVRALAIAAEERDALAPRLATARARREGGRAAADLAEAVASRDAAHLRAHLVDGEPCPVCGARDHPIVADPAVAEALARIRIERAAVDSEIADLERRLTALEGATAAATARRDDADRRRLAAETRRRDAEARLAPGLAALTDTVAALGLAVTLDPDPAAALAAVAPAVTAARATTTTALDAAVRLRGEIDDLRRGLDGLDAARELRRAARRSDADDEAKARAEIAAASETETGARRRLADLDARLAPLLEPLQIGLDDLDRDGETLIARLGRGVADRHDRVAARARASEEETTLERNHLAVSEALERAELAAAGTAGTLAHRNESLDRLVTERAGLLGGVATAEHRAGIVAEQTAAQAALDTATAALDTARSAHEAALTLHGERHAAVGEAEDDVRARLHDRDNALAAADLDAETAEALLRLAPEAIEALRSTITTLDARLVHAWAASSERRRDLETLVAAGRPTASRDDIEAVLAETRETGDGLNREIGALDHELAADDAARGIALGLESEIVTARAESKVWAALDDAIGSRDGAKFRQFAQGITLDRLAGLANRHLASLNPRYRLARAEGLGLTIVDRDMGDEMRSTRSLSGGERFLASLALALALSGLEGRRSFVDTLFIDEGFGSLDAATLDVAIDALEGLQSEGRKVGVISHVAAMHDRIPVQIRVEKAGAGRSRVRITDGSMRLA